ncbi:kinase-like protein, partial [Rhizophagus irregularis]
GVIPFVVPEVLRGKPCTPASDIYSFSIIMWEFTSGIPPFNDRAHDIQLASSICKGERSEIIENIPQCYIDLMKKCWNKTPSKRPSASEILDTIEKWIILPSNMKIKDINDEELKSNIMKFINAPIGHRNLITKTHPQACYTSQILGFTSEKLNEILEEYLKSKIFEAKQKEEDAEKKLIILENVAEIYYQSSQNELKEMYLAYQNIKLELHTVKPLYNDMSGHI